MPEKWRKKLEPNTSPLDQRLQAIPKFIDAGYDVHLNFSPVIVHDNWLTEYEFLFDIIKKHAEYNLWSFEDVKAEVIFLTHNEDKHKYNLQHNLPGEELIWTPKIQESKVSQYGGKNIRYEHNRKADYIKQFVELHNHYIPPW